jgi:hypothetical protein
MTPFVFAMIYMSTGFIVGILIMVFDWSVRSFFIDFEYRPHSLGDLVGEWVVKPLFYFVFMTFLGVFIGIGWVLDNVRIEWIDNRPHFYFDLD